MSINILIMFLVLNLFSGPTTNKPINNLVTQQNITVHVKDSETKTACKQAKVHIQERVYHGNDDGWMVITIKGKDSIVYGTVSAPGFTPKIQAFTKSNTGSVTVFLNPPK